MRKINLLQQSTASDPRLQELFTELSDTRFALAQAYVRFDNTTEPELVDACIFELNALQSRYNYLLRLVKESGGIAASRIYSEGAVTWGLTDKIGIAILCAFVLFSVVRLFAAPLRLAAKVLLNTALGFLALFLLGLTEPVTGFSLGLNFFNALTVGILGVPGLVLLVLLQMLFV